jgi:hypothetical protein
VIVDVTRLAVTDSGGVTNDPGAPTVADIDGSTTGAATYLISAHPAGMTNETFNFLAVNDPATMPLPMASTPMYATHALLVPSSSVEADVGGTWQGTVYAAQSRQQGLGVYVPLVAT